MKFLVILLLTAITAVSSFCQQAPARGKTALPEINGIHRSIQPGSALPDYPRLTLPEQAKHISLPPVADNSGQPYLRPVFRQAGASCGQSSTVGYNFCYEINRLRQLPSDTALNTYPDHFTYNFMNATEPYYGEGVSYFHTFDILYDAGNPTEAVYGPITLEDDFFWMSGYEKYYSAMKNRLGSVRSIHAGTPEGLEILKHWIHNHHEGSAIGGVASFYAGMNNVAHLPPASPEAGKSVVTAWLPTASHAMTIVGYNDSIRFDRNGDNMFTNHLDINNDGIVDMKDWETGGLKFVNSYGPDWENNGFCYMLYSTLATEYGKGGIWNNSAHVLFPDTAYTPGLTISAKVKYNKRGRIRISAGVSTDTSGFYPEKELQFSIFNYQGGDYYMTGSRLPDGKTLEMGLDITPLLSYIHPGQPARIFLIIDENDPDHSGEGLILEFSTISYLTGSPETFSGDETPVAIADNGRTLVSAIIQVQPDPPVILTEDIIIIPEDTEDFSFTPVISGGTNPVELMYGQIYFQGDSTGIYPQHQGEDLQPSNRTNGFARVAMPFSFPFFGETFDTLYMHVNGYLMFTGEDMPYYYQLYDEQYLRQIRAIAPFLNRNLRQNTSGDYLKVNLTPEKAVFTWKLTFGTIPGSAEFSAILYPDGTIEFQYGNSAGGDKTIPVSGISKGNHEACLLTSFSGKRPASGKFFRFVPSDLPGNVTITDDRNITIQNIRRPAAGSMLLIARDRNRLTCHKEITLTTGPAVKISLTNPGILPRPGTVNDLTISLSNHSTIPVSQAIFSLKTASSNITVAGDPVTGLNIQPGQTIHIRDRFSVIIPDTIQGEQPFLLKGTLDTGSGKTDVSGEFTIAGIQIVITPPAVLDNGNNLAEPGEAISLAFNLYNYGKSPVGNITASIGLATPYAAVSGKNTIEAGFLSGHDRIKLVFPVKINDAVPAGSYMQVNLNLLTEYGQQYTETFGIQIGNAAIAVIDKDKNYNSAVHIIAAINEINLACEKLDQIDSILNKYSTVFLSLGFFPQHHKLNAYEDSLLVSFLENGGNLYLEGGSFFRFDPPTALREKFSVTGLSQSFQHPADTLTGMPGTPAEGFTFHYRGDNFRGENLQAEGIAVPWFHDKNTGYCFTAGLDSARYNAIASTVEFGGTFMFNSPGRPQLMRNYLEFLGFRTTPLCASFTADNTQVCRNNQINYTAFTSGTISRLRWSFPGGEPHMSEEANPQIRYNTPGLYNVSLTVEDGASGSNTFTLEDYILVENCSGMDEHAESNYFVYPNPTGRMATLICPDRPESVNIRMIDLSGRTVFETNVNHPETSTQLRFPKLSESLYMLIIRTRESQRAIKLMIHQPD